MQTITIIGGGLSGTLLAINLLRQSVNKPVNIIIIEKNKGKDALGAAYSTNKPYHLLNVRARDMGALAEDRLHFVKWLKENKIPITPAAFAPRMIYRKYILSLLKRTISENKTRSRLERITESMAEAVG